MNTSIISSTKLARIGNWMRRNIKLIRSIQLIMILIYIFLILVPILLPLPNENSHIWSNLTLMAQFCFWGIWWPFVLISIIFMGRIWCGILCPEGTLTELASKYGKNKSIPQWIRWNGWPFITFALTTIYGQMVSVYQYPKAAFLILGGSTISAIIIGYSYGRKKRIWCQYLCPVNGVFNLLAKLAPLHYKVDTNAWRASYDKYEIKHTTINCAPLVPLRNMKGTSNCHMCGRCSGYRNAINLTWRPPTEEIVIVGNSNNNIWESALLLYGLFGIAIGAFHWSISPWFVQAKQWIATWLIEDNIMWPFKTNAPWWLLTNYPQQSDVFNWLDGAMVIAYILITSLVLGTMLTILFVIATLFLGKWQCSRFNHLVQTAIPLAACGIFIGLSTTTITLLRGEHLLLNWINNFRATLLTIMTIWSVILSWKVIKQHTSVISQRMLAMTLVTITFIIINFVWLLMFKIW